MGLQVSGGTVAAGSVTKDKLSTNAREFGGWLPTGAIAQTIPRWVRTQDSEAVASGTLYLMGGIVIPANATVTSITFFSAAASVSPTNQWFCLVDLSLNVLKKTVDDTTTAWAANAAKTLNLSSTYTPTQDTAVYVGCLQAAGTPATLRSVTGSGNTQQVAPIFAGRSTTGLTTPASLGATAAAISTSTGGNVWAYIS